MGGGKETPRQKMVGLMYLVLMALLAMNVSKEIINAFVTLNNKLESSIEQVESFNTGLSDEFATKLAISLVSLIGLGISSSPTTNKVGTLIVFNLSKILSLPKIPLPRETIVEIFWLGMLRRLFLKFS